MEREEILSIVQVTFQKNVQLDSALDEEFELYELDDYDSLTHFSVLIELEEKFKISFQAQEIGKMDSIKKIVDYISEELGKGK